MRSSPSRLNRVSFTVGAVVVLMGGCVHKPIVVNGSTCTIMWDRVDDPWVKEYKVTLLANVQAGEGTIEIHQISNETTQVESGELVLAARQVGSGRAHCLLCE